MFTVRERFHLSADFLREFQGKQPEWGPLGYITYKRTYARVMPEEGGRTEEYWETVRRVVEGCYTIQLNHCLSLKLPWKPEKAQRSAQEMYRLIWGFKFLPPGRGLWMMGTDYIYKRGSAALNNCAFVSTEEFDTDFGEPFCFLMDMSLLGVGVGLALSQRVAPFSVAGPWWQRVLRFLAGAVGLIALYFGLSLVFPGEGEPLYFVLRFVRYALVGLWATLGAPWLFLRLRLAETRQG